MSRAYAKGLTEFNAYEYDKSMRSFQYAFNEQFNSIYGNPINIRVNISNPDDNPAITKIISSIDNLASDIDISFKTIKNHIVNRDHSKLKHWVDTIYNNYATGDVDFKKSTELKRKLEDFIAETDYEILKDYLEP